ncbi:prepilin-type N-terminal cleavage/methylation domain-containing protein [Moritella sp. 5]|uniref:PulJ/GspJ family protein n=1 Tax=Moritella sp. 5 TaxID=2746231 RepID=UPI001BA9ED4A|nr:prepilin-type N-terminal cleavage/methylation domain-containing protein [Moritella sp. 5]QUM79010.1 prepilin-type N-terminal cleavage/methylation domain-containing protein [Moritella sp. 5]
MARFKLPQGSHAGFTLIELTMVILLLGIIGMFSSRFISSNVVLYQTSINQNERLNDARFIFNRLDKELNSAVAFSLRINTTGNYSCIDFVPFTAAGLYIGNVSGLSKMSLIMDRRTRERKNNENNFRGQYVSVLTTNADDFYSLPSSTVAEITNYVPVPSANPTQATLTFGSNLSRDSAVSRYFIAENKVQYCLLAIGDSMRLFRNQAPLSAQNFTLDNRVLMADDLSVDSSMNLTSASQFSHAILNLNFGFKLRDDSVLRFDHQLVISNVP